jgi:arylsulfatase A-like enzyme
VHLVTDVTSRLSGAVSTLPEQLARAGYYTAAIVHNDLLNPTSSLDQGFAYYRSIHGPAYGGCFGASLLQTLLPSVFPPLTWPTTQDQTALVIDWLEANRSHNFFLWVHYRDPHAPYQPPREYVRGQPPGEMGLEFEGQELITRGFVVPSSEERRWIRALYDAEARSVDAGIDRLLETLKQTTLYDEALIILTSDHGEEFWEHGGQGHGHSMFDELLKVPLIVKLPGSSRRGRVTTPVSTESITPTVLDVAQIRYADADLSAASLMRFVTKPGTTAGPLVSTAQILFDRREAVRMGGFKYIVSRIDGTEEVFDLDRDPGERHPMTTPGLDALEMGRVALNHHHEQSAALRKRLGIQRGESNVDEDTLRRLRTLGYIH